MFVFDVFTTKTVQIMLVKSLQTIAD